MAENQNPPSKPTPKKLPSKTKEREPDMPASDAESQPTGGRKGQEQNQNQGQGQQLQQQNEDLQKQLASLREEQANGGGQDKGPSMEGLRQTPMRVSRIKDRPVKKDQKESSLKIKIELDLEVEVDLYARVKGDVVIGLM